MIDVYLSKQFLEDNIEKDNAVMNLLRDEECRILFKDVSIKEINELNSNTDSCIYRFFKKENKQFYSGQDFIDNITTGQARGLVLDSNGVRVIVNKSIINLQGDIYDGIEHLKMGEVQYCKPPREEPHLPGKYGWAKLFGAIQPMPCDSIILNDHYFIPQGNNIVATNLSEIINGFLTWNPDIDTLHILIICADTSKNLSAEKIQSNFESKSKKITEILANSISENIEIIAEFINCLRFSYYDTKLYHDTHNRFTFSNYSVINAPHQLAAFSRNHATVNQTIDIGNILFQVDLSMTCHMIEKIAEAVKKGIKNANNEGYPYKYIKYRINNKTHSLISKDFKELENKFITNALSIQEGEGCFYLSVPNDNDWANIKTKHETYNASNFSKCVVARSEDKLKPIIDDIKKLFNITHITPTTDGERFFRIVAEYAPNLLDENGKPNAHVIESNPREKWQNQIQYTNNCFKNKSDAEDVANKINDIINKHLLIGNIVG